MTSAVIDKKQFNRELYHLAMPISLQSLMLALMADGDALMLGRIAQEEMTAVSLATQVQFVQNMFLAAANSIAAVVRDLICCVCNGVGSAAGIMVGNELGAGSLERGKAYGIRLKNISYVIGFASTALVLAVTPLVVRSVILTDQARSFLTGMMIIMAVYMIGRCVNTVTINGVLDGGGDTLFDMYSLIVCMWGIAIPLALAGAFWLNWPVLAVYACTCLDEVGKIPWVMYRFRKYKWVRNLTREQIRE